MQHLLTRAVWDTDAVAGELRAFVGEHLGALDGVLIVDETGDAKKGTSTVGVQRQYSGTLGRIENCQVAVHLAYASRRGHALVDRELYLPRSWTDDRSRCAAAGVPAAVAFATKPALAAMMIARALDASMAARWVTGDEVYGADLKLAAAIEARGLGYVLAIASTTPVQVDVVHRFSAASVAAALPDSAFEQRSAGAGAHGQRYHQWAWVALHPSTSRTNGSWSLLAMCAHALLAIITATERACGPVPAGLIAITCAEVRRLLILALHPPVDIAAALAWSRWRRTAQHRARTSHYAARGQQPPA